MASNKIYLTFIFLLLLSSSIIAQVKTKDSETPILPESLYTSFYKITEINSPFSLNNRLNFKSYEFVFLDEKKIKEGYFTIPIERMDLTPSNLVYETYADIYHQLNLEKSFFKLSNLYLPFNPHK